MAYGLLTTNTRTVQTLPTTCVPRVDPVPNHPTAHLLVLNPHHPPSHITVPPKPLNVESHSATAVVLDVGTGEPGDALMARENEQRAQRSTKTEPSKSVPDGNNLLAPAESSHALLLCLINDTVPQAERASLIEASFSSRNVTDMVHRLRGSDVQAFIDVIDEVRYHSSVPG
jgi:hypothetical protein